ncbi:hypothetical protein KI387_019709, partial [Taxus chinensis]
MGTYRQVMWLYSAPRATTVGHHLDKCVGALLFKSSGPCSPQGSPTTTATGAKIREARRAYLKRKPAHDGGRAGKGQDGPTGRKPHEGQAARPRT